MIQNTRNNTHAFPKRKGTTNKFEHFTQEEVAEVIRGAKNNIAAGPVMIYEYEEHLKLSQPILLEVGTQLINMCVELRDTPQKWRQSVIKILYKGKGDPGNINTYSGIALENNIFKILTKRIHERTSALTNNDIPAIWIQKWKIDHRRH
jgi:hypothetical protein